MCISKLCIVQIPQMGIFLLDLAQAHHFVESQEWNGSLALEYIDGLVQDFSISNALAMEIL